MNPPCDWCHSTAHDSTLCPMVRDLPNEPKETEMREVQIIIATERNSEGRPQVFSECYWRVSDADLIPVETADDGRDQRLLDAAEAARNAFFDRYYRPQVAQ